MKIEDKVLHLVLNTKSVFPSPALVLVGCTLSTLLQSGVQALGVLGDTFFDVADHALVVFALTVHAGLLILESGSSAAAIV